MKIRDLYIEVRLNYKQALAGLREVDKATRATAKAFTVAASDAVSFGKSADKAAKSAGSAFSGLAATLKGAVGGLGSILAAPFRDVATALRDPIGAAVEFETKMAEISKVVDGLKTPTGETTAEFDAMKRSIFDLSKTMAIAPAGFADIVAAAGQAGIAKEELKRFAEDAAKMAVAFDMGADQAGDAMAKLRTGLGLSQDDVMSLAGTMNHLSNNMASSAPELVDAARRVAALGGSAGMSAQQTTALASAMISSGAKTNVAATGIKNFTLALAAGEAATNRQQVGFERLGLNAVDVAKQFGKGGKEMEGAMRLVLTSLKDLDQAERASAIMQIFGRESMGAIAPLVTQIDNFDKAMALAGDSTAAASSVQDEYNVRAATTANTIQLLKNQVEIAAIEIGDALVPAVQEMLSLFASPEMQEIGSRLFGGFKDAAGEAAKAVADALPTLLSSAMDVGAAVGDALGPTIGGVTSVLSGVLDGITDTFSRVYEAIMPLISAIGDLGSTIVKALGLAGEEGEKFGEETANAFGDTLINVIEGFASAIRVVVDVLGFLMPVLQPVASFLKTVFVTSIEKVANTVGYLRDQITAVGDAFRSFTSANFGEGFAKLGQVILNSLIEPIRIVATQLVDLADAIPGGSSMVPAGLRKFAGRTATDAIAGMVGKATKAAGAQAAAEEAALDAMPMGLSRAEQQSRRKQSDIFGKPSAIEPPAEEEKPTGGGGGGGGKGKKKKKDEVVTDESILRSLYESPAETRKRLEQERKAIKDIKKTAKGADALTAAVMGASAPASLVLSSGNTSQAAGPAVSNHYTTINLEIDARGAEGQAANVDRAGRAAAARVDTAYRGAALKARAGGGVAAGAL